MTAPPQPQPQGEKKRDPAVMFILLAAGCAALICVIGIAAAIAIPAFINYVKRSKTAEASSNVMVMARGAESYCSTERLGDSSMYPTSPGGPLPTRPGSMKQTASFSADATFSALGFGPPDPVYYSYSAVPDARGGLRLTANGDLDDDGVLSTFESYCDSSCRCSPVNVVNELE